MFRCLWGCVVMTLLVGCDMSVGPQVVVYTALDRMYSEPILQQFERTTGIQVRVKYDTEATKTIGLVNALMAEQARPRCDVFWNNEILNTLRLKQAGLLAVYRSPQAEAIPALFRDPQGTWTGFAARARILLVNNQRVPVGTAPHSLADLTNPRWRGIWGMAKPLFGTTATHMACLFACLGQVQTARWLRAIKHNQVCIEASNRVCARKVATGELALALTDTDDAYLEILAQQPVRIVYLEGGQHQLGTLFIPNTVALIKNCPHPEAGRRLIDYLLSSQVEERLARGPSAQIPLNPAVKFQPPIKTPRMIKPMAVDFTAAAALFQQTANYLRKEFGD